VRNRRSESPPCRKERDKDGAVSRTEYESKGRASPPLPRRVHNVTDGTCLSLLYASSSGVVT